ncbi:hypothetical protein PR048_029369 [Dryococelus australis]|uniref:Uncharacterized protein n=1 Tax=Dryococelus australis TaxID=614101 RepID=A0ABQ9GDJ4_9NEOP|nr:hypothetical protein PR048_029369 [Dryococelus australis]
MPCKTRDTCRACNAYDGRQVRAINSRGGDSVTKATSPFVGLVNWVINKQLMPHRLPFHLLRIPPGFTPRLLLPTISQKPSMIIVAAVHDQVCTFETNLRKRLLLLPPCILTGALSDVRPSTRLTTGLVLVVSTAWNFTCPVGLVPVDAAGRRVFSGISRSRHCRAAPHLAVTLLGSQDLDVESRANLFTPHTLYLHNRRSSWATERLPNCLAGLKGWSSAGIKGRGKRDIPEKIHLRAASSGATPTCEISGMTRPGIESGSSWWEAGSLTAQPPRPHLTYASTDVRGQNARAGERETPDKTPPTSGICTLVDVRQCAWGRAVVQWLDYTAPTKANQNFSRVKNMQPVGWVFSGVSPVSPAILNSFQPSPGPQQSFSAVLDTCAEDEDEVYFFSSLGSQLCHRRGEGGEAPERGSGGGGKQDIPERTRRPAASSGTIPACENPGATPTEIEPGSPRWEASSLATRSPLPWGKKIAPEIDHFTIRVCVYFSRLDACLAGISPGNYSATSDNANRAKWHRRHG